MTDPSLFASQVNTTIHLIWDHLPELGADEFMIVHIPDTQYFIGLGTTEWETAATWIIERAADTNKKIAIAVHTGDVVDTGNNATQWTNAEKVFDILDGGTVPWLVTSGNHDYTDSGAGAGPIDDEARTLTAYEAALPQSRFTSQTGWSGGFCESGRSENAYRLMTIGGNDYIFITLEYAPRQAVIDWAAALCVTYSDRDVFFFTHAYLDGVDGGYMDANSTWPSETIIPGDSHNGLQIWNELVKLTANVRFVTCGHTGPAHTYRQDLGVNGNKVNQFMYCDHDQPDIQLFVIRPTDNKINVYIYSPALNRWTVGAEHQFEVDYT